MNLVLLDDPRRVRIQMTIDVLQIRRFGFDYSSVLPRETAEQRLQFIDTSINSAVTASRDNSSEEIKLRWLCKPLCLVRYSAVSYFKNGSFMIA